MCIIFLLIWMGHVARLGEKIACRNLIGKQRLRDLFSDRGMKLYIYIILFLLLYIDIYIYIYIYIYNFIPLSENKYLNYCFPFKILHEIVVSPNRATYLVHINSNISIRFQHCMLLVIYYLILYRPITDAKLIF
jgi:hypothetical protein